MAIDAAETLASFMRDGRPDRLRFREVVGRLVERAVAEHGKVHVFGEMLALLWARGNITAAIELEDFWNELANSCDFALFCAYPMASFDREADTVAFQEVCQLHSTVLPTESFSKLSDTDEQARAVAILQQEATAGINERVALRREQHELQDALGRTAALRHLMTEFMATVAHDDRGPGSPRPRNVETLQKTALRTVHRMLRAPCAFTPAEAGTLEAAPPATVTLPVTADGTVFGHLRLQLPADRQLDQGHHEFLEAVAAVLAAAHRHACTRRRLELQALHDPLTGLPNRTLLLDRLGNALRQRERTAERVAVLFADLNGFKRINDSLGHSAGDEILTVVAQRLQNAVRPGDTVARLGGDEFVILSEVVRDEIDALAMAERLLAALTAPLHVGGHEIFVTASIGVTIGRAGDQPLALLHDADRAMYRSKSAGPHQCELFQERPS